MQRAQLAVDVVDVLRADRRTDCGRALQRHDQMLAALTWVIEQATQLHPDGPPLDPLYDAYDFVHAMRQELAAL